MINGERHKQRLLMRRLGHSIALRLVMVAKVLAEGFCLSSTGVAGSNGSFIDQLETAERFPREFWFPQLLDRRYYQAWFDDQAARVADRCRTRKQELLRTHQPQPLDDAAIRELERIVTTTASKLR